MSILFQTAIVNAVGNTKEIAVESPVGMDWDW